jgi:hypothetical protein
MNLATSESAVDSDVGILCREQSQRMHKVKTAEKQVLPVR